MPAEYPHRGCIDQAEIPYTPGEKQQFKPGRNLVLVEVYKCWTES
jgi:hypothetical protein